MLYRPTEKDANVQDKGWLVTMFLLMIVSAAPREKRRAPFAVDSETHNAR